MDVQQMITLVTLAREQNFRRAAKVLQVSQPAVTMRIKLLEERLGTELFQRRGNAVTLTPSGEVVLRYVERMLHLIQEGRDHVFSLPSSGKKRLSVEIGRAHV